MNELKRKLTSRKFWMAVAGFVTALLAAFGVADSTSAQVAGIIMAGASVIGYLVGEGLADAARASVEPLASGDDAGDVSDAVDEPDLDVTRETVYGVLESLESLLDRLADEMGPTGSESEE